MITCIFIDKYLEGVRSALALIWGRRMMFLQYIDSQCVKN